MTANPVSLIGGMTSTANVPKADVIGWAKARVQQRVADATELRGTDFSGQLGGVYVASLSAAYRLDTSDTTTADDGLSCIIDSVGNRFKQNAYLSSITQDAFGQIAIGSNWTQPYSTFLSVSSPISRDTDNLVTFRHDRGYFRPGNYCAIAFQDPNYERAAFGLGPRTVSGTPTIFSPTAGGSLYAEISNLVGDSYDTFFQIVATKFIAGPTFKYQFAPYVCLIDGTHQWQAWDDVAGNVIANALTIQSGASARVGVGIASGVYRFTVAAVGGGNDGIMVDNYNGATSISFAHATVEKFLLLSNSAGTVFSGYAVTAAKNWIDVTNSSAAVAFGAGNVTIGSAGSVVGNLSFANATNGTVSLIPTTGALGASVLTLPAVTATVAYAEGAWSSMATTVVLTGGSGGSPALTGKYQIPNAMPKTVFFSALINLSGGIGTNTGINFPIPGGGTANCDQVFYAINDSSTAVGYFHVASGATAITWVGGVFGANWYTVTGVVNIQ